MPSGQVFIGGATGTPLTYTVSNVAGNTVSYNAANVLGSNT
jgi:hypothetical protein